MTDLSSQEYWSGFAISSSRGSSQHRIKPASLVSRALAGGFFTAEPLGKHLILRSQLKGHRKAYHRRFTFVFPLSLSGVSFTANVTPRFTPSFFYITYVFTPEMQGLWVSLFVVFPFPRWGSLRRAYSKLAFQLATVTSLFYLKASVSFLLKQQQNLEVVSEESSNKYRMCAIAKKGLVGDITS